MQRPVGGAFPPTRTTNFKTKRTPKKSEVHEIRSKKYFFDLRLTSALGHNKTGRVGTRTHQDRLRRVADLHGRNCMRGVCDG